MATGVGNELSHAAIRSIFTVHNSLGPGFLEKIYRNALIVELAKRGLSIEVEKEVSIYYDGVEVGCHRLDMIVENRLILELKTVNKIGGVHYAQVRSYLKATAYELALLVNFADVSADIRRIEHPPPSP